MEPGGKFEYGDPVHKSSYRWGFKSGSKPIGINPSPGITY